MRSKLLVAGITAVILLFALQLSPVEQSERLIPAPVVAAAQTCDREPGEGYTHSIHAPVDGDELVVTISSRFGGAVESLTWRGVEFINIWDHGRQISYAWGMDGYGECLNPTEPGSARDYQAPTSSSRLLEVCSLGESGLATTTQPAFWLGPGESGYCDGGATEAVNTTIVSDHLLEKTMVIGYAGIENVIVFTATVTLPRDYSSNQLEIPTAYLTHEFDRYLTYNPGSGELVEAEPQPLHEPWSFFHVTDLPVILATQDGGYAMGAYTAEPIVYYSLLGYDVGIPDDDTNKWNMVIREEPAPAGRYTYVSFAVVGTLEQVQAGMDALYALHPADFNPPEGYVDLANCSEIAGWAWDPKAPNQPIEVEIFDVLPDGREILLASTTADLPRPDLPPVLGDNGEHGYSISAADVLPDGGTHLLRVYAVNSDPRLPGRALIPTEHTLTCPQFAPTATSEAPTQTPAETVESTSLPQPSASPAETGQEDGGFNLPCAGGLLPLIVVIVEVGRRRRSVRGGARSASV